MRKQLLTGLAAIILATSAQAKDKVKVDLNGDKKTETITINSSVPSKKQLSHYFVKLTRLFDVNGKVKYQLLEEIGQQEKTDYIITVQDGKTHQKKSFTIPQTYRLCPTYDSDTLVTERDPNGAVRQYPHAITFGTDDGRVFVIYNTEKGYVMKPANTFNQKYTCTK